MNWLITGGCGFIGTSLVNRLVSEKDYGIRIIDNLSVGTREDLGGVCSFEEITSDQLTKAPRNVELVVADILDEETAIKAAKGIDIIVHLAASAGIPQSVENPSQDCSVNITGTLNYLESARSNNVEKFIFASSGATLGEQTPPICEEKVPKPISPYGASKLAGEAYCLAYFRTFGIKTVVLRFGNVYGPRSSHKNSVVAKFIKHAIGGKPLEIYGDGKQTRDFIYIDDLIDAVHKSALANLAGEICQIASNSETTICELAQILLPILHEVLPGRTIEVIHSESRVGDVRRNFADISKAKALLNWRPHISLSEGLGKTVSWFMNSSNS